MLPDSLEAEPLLADLAAEFRIVREEIPPVTGRWFDTDDWRLHRKGLLLVREKERWALSRLENGETVAAVKVPETEKVRFAWDFPDSSLRATLEPILDVRALLPLFTRQRESTCIRIRNKDGKTLVFLYLDTYRFRESGTVYKTITLKGVRGYDGPYERVRAFLSSYGIQESVSRGRIFELGVRGAGREVRDYISKFDVVLQPGMTARQAMVRIYQHLLQTLLHNERGIALDLDTEFLHDYRVAVRRTRSGLGQVREVLPGQAVERAKKGFAWLGSITGPTRDLDVYLLDRQRYMERLPEHLQANLEPFFEDMARRREREWRKLVTTLQSKKYRKLTSWWSAYLGNAEQEEVTGYSERPIRELAAEIIFRKYGKILRQGGKIDAASPDEKLHRLRIQCKKLRYLLEFFPSLFPPGEMKRAVKQLKRLQDNLGTFNDLSVQREMLQGYVNGLRPGSRRNQDLSTAIGGLLATLYHEQLEVKEEFFDRFSRFAGEENRRLYSGLFS